MFVFLQPKCIVGQWNGWLLFYSDKKYNILTECHNMDWLAQLVEQSDRHLGQNSIIDQGPHSLLTDFLISRRKCSPSNGDYLVTSEVSKILQQ